MSGIQLNDKNVTHEKQVELSIVFKGPPFLNLCCVKFTCDFLTVVHLESSSCIGLRPP